MTVPFEKLEPLCCQSLSTKLNPTDCLEPSSSCFSLASVFVGTDPVKVGVKGVIPSLDPRPQLTHSIKNPSVITTHTDKTRKKWTIQQHQLKNMVMLS